MSRCESRLASTTETRRDGTFRPIARCVLDAGHGGEHRNNTLRHWTDGQEAEPKMADGRTRYTVAIPALLGARLRAEAGRRDEHPFDLAERIVTSFLDHAEVSR